jgi:hypothetical protein
MGAFVAGIAFAGGWTLSHAIEHGIAHILDHQRTDVSRFWSGADVNVEGGNPGTRR